MPHRPDPWNKQRRRILEKGMNTTTVMRAWLLALSLVAGLSGCWWDSDGKKKLNITSEPANATAVVGATATFSVQANTNKATYQWRRNGTDIAGATSASYTTPATVAGDSGTKFSVVLTRGKKSVTSSEATLTVNVPPAITTQPANATVQEGGIATFSVGATGTAPLSYQWRKDGTNITGATADAYTTAALAVGDNGAAYSVVVTNPAGSVTSGNAILTVQSPDTTPVVWDPALVVSAGSPGASDFDNPSAALDDQGRGYAAWINNAGRVLASSGSLGGTWSTAAFVDAGPDMVGNIGAAAPRFAVSPTGKGVLAWNFFTTGFASHLAVVVGEGGVWSLPKKLASNYNSDYAPEIAIDDSGRALVVWSTSVTSQKIMASVYNGTTWSTPVALGRDPNLGGQPRLGLNGDGKGMVVYSEATALVAIPVDLALLQPFGTPVEAVRPGDPPVDLQLAVDPQGGAALVYYEFFNNEWSLRGTNLRPGTGWTDAVTIDYDVPLFARNISLASDSQGNAIAAWAVQEYTVPGGESKNTLFTSRYTPTGGWSTPELRPSVDADGVENIQIVASRTGRFVVAWTQYLPTTFVTEAWAQVFEDGEWKAAGRVSSGVNEVWFGDSQPTLNRALAIGPSGDALLLWIEDDGATNTSPVLGAFLPKPAD